MRARRTLAVAVASFLLAAAAVAGSATSAVAHDRLVAASPGEDETVTDLSAVTLTYSGVLLGGGTGANLATVAGPDGRFYETACASVSGDTMIVPVAPGPAGSYEVVWRVVSSDGHPVSGSYRFTYESADAGDTGATTHPCSDIATEPAPTSPASPVPDGGGLPLGLGIGAAALVVVGAMVALILRPRKRVRTGEGEASEN